jgi:uncharacterized protein
MSSTRQPGPKSRSSADALTFNVAGLLAEPVGSIRDVKVESGPLDLGLDLRQSRGVSGNLRLTRTNRGLLVQGRLDTSIDQECSRCLREIDFPLELELEEEALPGIDLVSGLPLDTTAEPDVLRLNDHHELELENEIREAIMLSEPIAPLCRPDCPGLCPICGQELASGPHDHHEADVDPRLEALRDFKPSREG